MKNLRRLLPTVVLVIAGVWLNSGCGKKTVASSHDLLIGTETDITTLDPNKVLDPHVIRIEGQIYEGLVGLDENNQVIPRLAESWTPNEAFDKWRFNLRKGVHFHESAIFGDKKTREVAAEDVVFSLNRIAGKGSSISWLLEGVIKRQPSSDGGKTPGPLAINVLGPSEVEIELTSPDPFFVQRLTSTPLVILPKEVAGIPEGDFGVKTVVGTGPFRMVSRSDAETVLQRNPDYWKAPEGNVEKLTFRVIKNDQIRLQELKNSQIDFAVIPLTMADGVVTDQGEKVAMRSEWNGFHLSEFRTFNVVALGFNCEKMDTPLRAALSLGIRRSDLIKIFPKGLSEVDPGPIPLAVPGYKPAVSGDIFDAAKAKAELALSQSALRSAPIEILIHERDASEQLGQLIQAQLKEIGIETKLTKLDYNAVIGRMVSGDFSAFIIGFEFTYPAPAPIAEMLFSPSKIPAPNFWRYRNPEVTAILDKLKTTSDPQQATQFASEIDKIVVADPPAAFLLQNKMLVVYQGRVSNILVNGQSIPLFWKTKVD